MLSLGTVVGLIKSWLKPVETDLTDVKNAIEGIDDDIDEIKHGKNIPKVNYLNPNTVATGKQLKSDGTLSDNESYNCSGFCDIDDTKTYAVITGFKPSNPDERGTKEVYRLIFYNAQQEKLSAGTNGSNNEYEIPSGAKYLRFSAGNSTGAWVFEPMVEYVDNISEISETFVTYTDEPVKTRGIESLVEQADTEKIELTILAVNCGAFDHDDSGGTITDAEYKANWRTMLNASKADLFALSDCPKAFGELEDDSPIVLFGNTVNKFDNHNSYGSGLALASRINATFIESIDVGGEGAWRKTVLKFKIAISGKEIILYVGHYQPEENMASVRAGQYANVIADASTNGYEYVIFAGDFNAWNVSEYAPFTTAGYVICNGGYTGDHLTLRDIPADNIIYSANMLEKNFEVLTGYTLNTDHKAIMAMLMLK